MAKPQNKGRTGPARDAKGRLLPGQSGNPGGRPKVLEEVRELAQLHTVEALDVLVELMRDGETGAVRLAAAEKVLERGWGKAAQAVHVAGHDGGPLDALRGMTEVQLLAALAALNAAEP